MAVKNGGYYLAYENLIALLFKQKRCQEVVKVVQKGLQILPANFKLNYFTALAYYKLGNKELAQLWLRRLLTLYPHNPLGLNLLQLVGK